MPSRVVRARMRALRRGLRIADCGLRIVDGVALSLCYLYAAIAIVVCV